MSQSYPPFLSKKNKYPKILNLNTIIVVLIYFSVFTSLTTLANAQNATNSTEINTLFNSSLILYNQQKYDEALQNLDKALQIDPNYTDALNSKGNVLKELCRQ